MQKVLLVDTNISSSPIYEFLTQSGYEVFVTGGNPADFLAKSATNYINIDYSDVSKMRDLVTSLSIDFIVPGCNDLSYKIASKLNYNNKFYGLDSIENTEIINDKEKFREFAKLINLSIPKVFSIDKTGDVWPLIIKPVDAYSGRGVTIIAEAGKDSLPEAIQNARIFSRSKKYIVEEYVDGQLYSHSAFIANGDILIDFIVEEHCTANPFVVDTSRVVYNFSPDMLNKIREGICFMAKHLNLIDGLVHTQFIKHNESFWIIEITRRCPGDLYSQLIEMSTGFRYAEAYLKPFLHQPIILPKEPLKCNHIMRHTVSQQEANLFSSLKFNLPVQIEQLFPLSLAGDEVKASPFGRIALLFTRSNSDDELKSIFKITLQRELYSIK